MGEAFLLYRKRNKAPAVEIGTFIFEGTQIEFEIGMTWADFVGSKYNNNSIFKFSIYKNGIDIVVNGFAFLVTSMPGIGFTASSLIVAGVEYFGT